MKLDLTCCLCDTKTVVELPNPEGWEHTYNWSIDVENCFCPEHAAVKEFRDAQCPGCVGGWMDCNLWRDFAFDDMRLGDAEFDRLRAGYCPRRTNGTMMVDRQPGTRPTVEGFDLSERAPTGGPALAEAILAYRERYGE